jgi:putative endonuclease
VYVLFSKKSNSYYIGETSDLTNRLKWHNTGEFKKAHTKIADDWEIFFVINCTNSIQARKIEKHIKAMKSKIYLENLDRYPEISQKLLEKYI